MGFTKFPLPTNRTVDFTSSGTWTCPAGVYSAEFLVVGAGGAGGGVGASAVTRYANGGGGGGGAVKKVTLPTVPGSSYTITIGAKGTGSSAAAGGNGGFSEVLLSGTTLIRSFGGRGGNGVTATDSTSISASTGSVGGGAGRNSRGATATACGGGGGGAFAANLSLDANALLVIQNFTSNSASFTGGIEGSFGRFGNDANAYYGVSLGQPGIDGFGAGGGGSMTGTSAYDLPAASAPYGAGAGVQQTTSGSTAGNNAIANTGSGGGGASLHTNTTSRAGGDGADGIVRITYFG